MAALGLWHAGFAVLSVWGGALAPPRDLAKSGENPRSRRRLLVALTARVGPLRC